MCIMPPYRINVPAIRLTESMPIDLSVKIPAGDEPLSNEQILNVVADSGVRETNRRMADGPFRPVVEFGLANLEEKRPITIRGRQFGAFGKILQAWHIERVVSLETGETIEAPGFRGRPSR